MVHWRDKLDPTACSFVPTTTTRYLLQESNSCAHRDLSTHLHSSQFEVLNDWPESSLWIEPQKHDADAGHVADLILFEANAAEVIDLGCSSAAHHSRITVTDLDDLTNQPWNL